jgi:uncharacterized protein with FMN-binding domain
VSTSHSDKENSVRRTALTIVTTIIGLVLLLSFKTHSSGTSTGTLATLAPVPSKATSPSQRASSPARHRPQSASPTTPAHRHSSRATKSPAARPITVTGQTIQTRYGPVQVRIVEASGHLTDVTAIQLPSDNSHSSEIAANAVPILRQEALRANSARIDIVSGATYTSDGYAQSLQSALDNA